jgi:hypothetical protein
MCYKKNYLDIEALGVKNNLDITHSSMGILETLRAGGQAHYQDSNVL